MAEGRYHVESGKIEPAGLLKAIAAGVAGGAVAGAVYGFLGDLLPYNLISLGVLLVAILVVGFGTGWMVMQGLVRSRPAAAFAGLCAGGAMLYGAWVAFLFTHSSGKLLALAPGTLWRAIRLVAMTGAWEVDGEAIAGAEAWVMWVIEALVIVIGTTLVAWATLADTPFCESCGVWAEEVVTGNFEPVGDRSAFQHALEQEDYSQLTGRRPVEGEPPAWLELRVQRCPGGEGHFFLSASAGERKPDKEGKPEESRTTLFEHMLVPGEIYALVESSSTSGSGEST